MVQANIETGQIVFVTTTGFYDTKPNLIEYKVTRVNGSSFYAQATDVETNREDRFDKKKMICRTGYGYTKKAYMKAEDYWQQIELNEETNNLRMEIEKAIKSMDRDTLLKMNELINSKA